MHKVITYAVGSYQAAQRVRFSALALLLGFCSVVHAQDDSSKFDCLIEPWQTVDVSFADHGIINSIAVEVGDTVKKGDVLAGLDSGVETASVELRRYKAKITDEISAAEATEAFSERNLKRIKNLYKKNAIPYHKLDEAETDLKVARNKLQQARDNQKLSQLELKMAEELLYRRTIRSPLDGVVIKRQKSVGEYLEEEPVLTLAQMNPLRVQLLMPVSLFGRVEVGMEATVTPEAPLSDRQKTAKVVIVDKNVDVASGTFGVQLELDNTTRKIPGGLKCTVNFKALKPAVGVSAVPGA